MGDIPASYVWIYLVLSYNLYGVLLFWSHKSPTLHLSQLQAFQIGTRPLTSKKKSQRIYIWVFPKIGVPQNGWFIMENPIKWMIWGYHYFWKHPFASLFKLANHIDEPKNLNESIYHHYIHSLQLKSDFSFESIASTKKHISRPKPSASQTSFSKGLWDPFIASYQLPPQGAFPRDFLPGPGNVLRLSWITGHTVDERNPANQLRLVVYPVSIIGILISWLMK